MRSELTVGAVVGETVRIWIENVRMVGAVALCFCLPEVLFVAWARGMEDTARDFVEFAIGVVMTSLMTAALTFGVIDAMHGRRVDGSASVVRGLRRGGAAVKVGGITGLLAILGLAAFVVPGVVALCVWAVVLPAAVVERVDSPLRRSATLTAGHRWVIFFAVIALLVLSIGWELVARQLVGLVPLATGGREAALRAVTAPIDAVWAILTIVLFERLREQREGSSAAALAEVFE